MKINHEKFVIYGLLIVVSLTLVFAVKGFSKVQGKSQIKDNVEIPKSNYETISSGSTSPGEVSIELTPDEISDNQLKVKIAVNTHTVDLTAFNLKEITTLHYDGQTLKPSSAPSLEGHHSNGDFVFDITNKLNEFTIKIQGVPKVTERVFNWEVK